MDKEIAGLMMKPLWQMTGEEFIMLMQATLPQMSTDEPQKRNVAYGIDQLGEVIGCSRTKIWQLRKNNKLEEAVLSKVGKKIIFDVDKAFRLVTDLTHNDSKYEMH